MLRSHGRISLLLLSQGRPKFSLRQKVERVSARSQRKCRGTVERAVRKEESREYGGKVMNEGEGRGNQ